MMKKSGKPSKHNHWIGHFQYTEEHSKSLLQGFSNNYCKRLYHQTMDLKMHVEGNEAWKKFKKSFFDKEKEYYKKKYIMGKKPQHQVVRSLRHLHFGPIRMIIKAYIQVCENKNLSVKAKQALVDAINMEINNYSDESNKWDLEVIKFISSNDKALQCLHDGLIALKEDVWVLEWCGDWRSYRMFWEYEYGPGNLLVKRLQTYNDEDYRPVYFTIQNKKNELLPVHLRGYQPEDDKNDKNSHFCHDLNPTDLSRG